MNLNPSIEYLLEDTLEKIHGPPLDDCHSSDEGELDDCSRRDIFQAIEEALDNDDDFRHFKARLACLCASSTRTQLSDTEPAQKKSLQLLDSLCTHVDAANWRAIDKLDTLANEVFESADMVDSETHQWLTGKNHGGKRAPYAMAAIAQSVRLLTGGIETQNIHQYTRRIDPDQWMPEFFAAMATAGGRPQWQESEGYKMAHYWIWYLTTAIPLSLNPQHPCDTPQFTAPPDTPPQSRKRFTSRAAHHRPRDPSTTRRPFLHGYVDTTVNTQGRTTFMRFVHEGTIQGRLNVNYRSRSGTYTDDQYTGVNYRSGDVEEVHLSHLAGTEQGVPIDQWVQQMEAMLLQDVLSSRIGWLLAWVEGHWNPPDGLVHHKDDIRICLESIEWVFRASGVTVETGRPYHQISWCLCAFALGEQLDRAIQIFPDAWQADKTLFDRQLETVDKIVGDRVAGLRVLPTQKRTRWWPFRP